MSFDLKISKGDIVISSDGTLGTVSGTNKVQQDILKIMLTGLGDNKFHPTYGSKIGSIEIGNIPDPDLIDSDLRTSAEEAILKLISMQKQQEKFQFIGPEERILSIKYIDVTRDEIDPRLYNIFISVVTQKLSTIEDTIVVRII